MMQVINQKTDQVCFEYRRQTFRKVLELAKLDALMKPLEDFFFKEVKREKDEFFAQLLLLLKKQQSLNNPFNSLQRLKIASKIISLQYPIIVLIGGACGTGKSTISAVLGINFNINDVMSTDTFRHILRGFLPREGNQALFGSTYEAYKSMREEDLARCKDVKQRVVQGFSEQCKIVQRYLLRVIDHYAKERQPLILEGVHLTPEFMAQVQERHGFVFPFVIRIKNEVKHTERFSVRSQKCNLQPQENKYVQNIQGIRTIQAWVLEQCSQHNTAVLSNNNVDRSIFTIVKAVMKYFKLLRRSSVAPSFEEIVTKLVRNEASLKKRYIKSSLGLRRFRMENEKPEGGEGEREEEQDSVIELPEAIREIGRTRCESASEGSLQMSSKSAEDSSEYNDI